MLRRVVGMPRLLAALCAQFFPSAKYSKAGDELTQTDFAHPGGKEAQVNAAMLNS
jgi:hypothetical protein